MKEWLDKLDKYQSELTFAWHAFMNHSLLHFVVSRALLASKKAAESPRHTEKKHQDEEEGEEAEHLGHHIIGCADGRYAQMVPDPGANT